MGSENIFSKFDNFIDFRWPSTVVRNPYTWYQPLTLLHLKFFRSMIFSFYTYSIIVFSIIVSCYRYLDCCLGCYIQWQLPTTITDSMIWYIQYIFSGHCQQRWFDIFSNYQWQQRSIIKSDIQFNSIQLLLYY